MKYVGAVALLPGLFALIPFKADYLQMFDYPFFLISAIGIVLLLLSSQRIGWRLNLEGNIVYYSKFNLYSSWKKRRSSEFALPVEKIVSVNIKGSNLVFEYTPSKRISFSVVGLDKRSRKKIDKMKKEIENLKEN